MKIKKVLALLFFLGCACAASVALPACSGTQQAEQANATASKAGRSSRTGGTVTVGKVQSVVGNQVVLAVGTLGGQSGRSGGSQSAPPSGNASVSASSGSGGITLTGETKTVLIPVGLSLSSGSTGRASGAPPPRRAAAGSARREAAPAEAEAGPAEPKGADPRPVLPAAARARRALRSPRLPAPRGERRIFPASKPGWSSKLSRKR